VKKQQLLGAWVHAHERDGAGVSVYVGADEPLPPSRGRQRLTFLDDGRFEEGRPGADDRAVRAGGTYELDGERLTLHRSGFASAVFEASADGTSLRLKKLPG
jgi:hypothetical protein